MSVNLYVNTIVFQHLQYTNKTLSESLTGEGKTDIPLARSFPSWPYSFQPHVYSWLSSVTAAECRAPQLTTAKFTLLSGFSINVGRETVEGACGPAE